METNKLLQADYLDIIYENRNKFYGGYELRRNYVRRMKKAGLFMMLTVSSTVLLSFISLRKDATNRSILPATPTVLTTIDMKKAVTPEVLPPRPSTPPPPPAPTKIFTVPKITNEEIKPEQQMSEVHDLKNTAVGTSDAKGDSMATDMSSAPKGPTGPAITIAATPVIPTFIEQMPLFDGDLNAYLSANLEYPEMARNAGVEGRVAVTFIVNEDGSISDVAITRGIGAGCNEEALRVIQKMPRWKPGKNNGKPAKVYYTQPISFRLQ
ncbi:MAG: energy transducer TonB [Taibaiella sp.]|nr:energy transducer TonB [Taibaiella sp.]